MTTGVARDMFQSRSVAVGGPTGRSGGSVARWSRQTPPPAPEHVR